MPYLALKANWLAGGQLGVANVDDARRIMVALNVVTAGMDLAGIAIALAFTHAWGQRVPAWLVLPPAWVAMGLLVRFVLVVPLTPIARALAEVERPHRQHRQHRQQPSQPRSPRDRRHLWLYVLVYGEFVGLGLGLSLAFVLYARVRWHAARRPG